MRAITVALLLLCLAFSLPSRAQAPAADDPKELAKQAGKLTDENKLDEALALYQKALAASPDLYEAHSGAGIVLDLKGDYAGARKHLARAIELANPQQKGRALRTMAVSYAFERKPAEIEKYAGQAFEARLAANDFPGAAGVANEMARLLLESGALDAAEKWYRTGYETALRTTDLKPTEKALWEFRWHHAQARLAARRGKKGDAQKHVAAAKTALDQALQDKENAGQAVYFPYLTGYVAFYGGDHRKAIAELSRADQRDPFILALLAQAYEKTGDAAHAQELYRKVLESTNHNPTNAYARPLALEKLKATGTN